MSFKSLKISALLVGWLFVQFAALSHEFSEEHWFSGNNHACLVQAVHLEDTLESDFELELIFNEGFISIASSKSVDVVSPIKFNLPSVRAPPIFSNA